MSEPQEPSKAPSEYNMTGHAGNIYVAITSTANALYSLVEEALAEHEGHEEEECEFESFARDVLGALDRHADQMSGEPGTWDETADDSSYG